MCCVDVSDLLRNASAHDARRLDGDEYLIWSCCLFKVRRSFECLLASALVVCVVVGGVQDVNTVEATLYREIACLILPPSCVPLRFVRARSLLSGATYGCGPIQLCAFRRLRRCAFSLSSHCCRMHGHPVFRSCRCSVLSCLRPRSPPRCLHPGCACCGCVSCAWRVFVSTVPAAVLAWTSGWSMCFASANRIHCASITMLAV